MISTGRPRGSDLPPSPKLRCSLRSRKLTHDDTEVDLGDSGWRHLWEAPARQSFFNFPSSARTGALVTCEDRLCACSPPPQQGSMVSHIQVEEPKLVP